MTSESKSRGRPRAAAEDKRSEQVCLRMTTAELELIDRAVELTHGKTRNTVMISLLTSWAFETVHRLGDQAEVEKWRIERFPGILDDHLPKGVVRVPQQTKRVALTGEAIPRGSVLHSLEEAPSEPAISPLAAQAMLEQLLKALQAAQPK